MTAREILLALAARCEAATGADREIDLAIFRVLHPEYAGPEWQPFGNGLRHVNDSSDVRCLPPPSMTPSRWTASLDAAMTLACDEWDSMDLFRDAGEWFCVVKAQGKGGVYRELARVHHATPALALCAAALSARAESLIC